MQPGTFQKAVFDSNLLAQVAKKHGSDAAQKVVFLWARSLGGEAAVKLLTKFGLLEFAVEFSTEKL